MSSTKEASEAIIKLMSVSSLKYIILKKRVLKIISNTAVWRTSANCAEAGPIRAELLDPR